MLVFRKGIYYRSFWFLHAADSPTDVMVAMFQEDKGPWRSLMRVRLSASSDPWDTRDAKQWKVAELRSGVDIEKAFRSLHERLVEVAAVMKLELDQTDINSDDPEYVMNLMSGKSWWHARRVPATGSPDRDGVIAIKTNESN
jgi:hypothetical protein